MSAVKIDVEGLQEAINKLSKIDGALEREWKDRMGITLNVLWENVPAYPPAPADSTYIRTGKLGQSIGVNQGGGKAGKPSIYEVRGRGSNAVGRIGTNLSYAQYVIDMKRQARVHQGRWWTIETIKTRAAEKIREVWRRWVRAILGR